MSTPPNDDSDLRGLLDDAVSGVHPSGGTDEIRARTRRPAAASRWVPITLAAAVATVAVIGGAAWLGRQGDDPAATGGGPSRPTVQRTEPAPKESRTVRVPVYYVGPTASGPRLFAETHTVEHVTDSNLDAAVRQALEAPASDPDYDVWTPAEGLVTRTSSDSATLTVDLAAPLERPAGMDEETAATVIQALVWTSDAMTRSEAPVSFTVDGEPAPEVLGVDTSQPVSRASADSVLAPVSISGPLEGATVPTKFQVTGQAATFEANVVWELKQGGRVVRNGFTTASECCTLSPYAFTVTAAPGDYTLVVHDTDESDGEGVGTSEDSKRITVE